MGSGSFRQSELTGASTRPAQPVARFRSGARRPARASRCVPVLSPARLHSSSVATRNGKRRTPKRPYGPQVGCGPGTLQRATPQAPPQSRIPNRPSRVVRKLTIPRGGSRFGLRRSAPQSHFVPNVSGRWHSLTSAGPICLAVASLELDNSSPRVQARLSPPRSRASCLRIPVSSGQVMI
jgi:hypothetical protein